MMLGKPIIVANNTNMDLIIEKEKCGIIIEYGDKGDLERALEKLVGNEEFRSELGENARRAYEEKYSWSKMEERLLLSSLLQSVLESSYTFQIRCVAMLNYHYYQLKVLMCC